jgi:hypothetical protein
MTCKAKLSAPLIDPSFAPEVFASGVDIQSSNESFTKLLFWSFQESPNGGERLVTAKVVLTPKAISQLRSRLFGEPLGRA